MRVFWSSLLSVGCALALSGASTSIGVVRSYGEFKVDGAAVRGNSTLLTGDVVESATMNATANVGNAELTLLPASRVTVYKDHTTLQKGTTLLRGASHSVEAGTLRVVPSEAHSLVTVGYSDKKVISISTHAGAAEVFTSNGQLLASLNPGGALAFEPGTGTGAGASASGARQAGANAPVQLHGTLTAKDGKYFVTMDGKLYEVTSSTINLGSYVGKVIDATASIVSVTPDLTVVAINTVTAAAAAAGAGLTAATVVVIVGAATAGVLGGLAASGSFSGSNASTP